MIGTSGVGVHLGVTFMQVHLQLEGAGDHTVELSSKLKGGGAQ